MFRASCLETNAPIHARARTHTPLFYMHTDTGKQGFRNPRADRLYGMMTMVNGIDYMYEGNSDDSHEDDYGKGKG